MQIHVNLQFRGLLKKLEEQDTEFKKYHYIIIKLLDNEEELEQEPVKLDDPDNKITDFYYLSPGSRQH